MEKLLITDSRDIPKDFTGVAEYSNGLRQWYKEGNLHREDGPAVELADGTKIWFKEGKRHREDGPARENPKGGKEWYKEGKYHRIDGPAVEYLYGQKEWWIDGQKLFEEIDISNKLFLGKEKGKYGLEWLKFLTENEIEEYPIIPGMNYQFSKKYTLKKLISAEK